MTTPRATLDELDRLTLWFGHSLEDLEDELTAMDAEIEISRDLEATAPDGASRRRYRQGTASLIEARQKLIDAMPAREDALEAQYEALVLEAFGP